MLTKGDLSAIKTIVQDEVQIIVKKEVKAIVKEEISGEIKGLKTEIAELRTDTERNTKDLVELITAGFSMNESTFQKHEQRITHLESIVR